MTRSEPGRSGSRLAHPGPAPTRRLETLGFLPVPVSGEIAAGRPLDAEIDRILEEAGCEGAVLTLGRAGLDPMAYVGPALSPDAAHAVWYSAVQEPHGEARFEEGVAIVGRRDGARFVHCHGFWHTSLHPDGTCGHLLCDRSVASAPMTVSGIGSRAARFETRPDPETNFPLFAPTGEDVPDGAFYLRVRPHEEIGEAIASACRDRGVGEARIAGLGSLNGVAFADGTALPGPPTEFFIEAASFRNGRVDLRICAVDAGWCTHRGDLARGANPVCVTCELLVVPLRG